MATTSRKRQKELKRQEKSKLKEAKRAQRKLEKAAHKEAGSAARRLTQLRRTDLRRKNRQVQVNWSQDEYMDNPSHAQEERRKLASLAIEAVRKSLGTKRSKNCCG